MTTKMQNSYDCELNPSLVSSLLELLRPHTTNTTNFIDPCAGKGIFLHLLPVYRTIGYDLLPEHPDVIRKNWFEVDTLPKDSCVVGSLPVGRRDSLSKDFIRHAIDLGAETIALVLPMSYQKPTLQNIFPSEYKLLVNEELPRDSFFLGLEKYSLPCCFQVWSQRPSPAHEDLRFKRRTCDQVTNNGSNSDRNEFFKIVKSKDKDQADMFVRGSDPTDIMLVDEVGPNDRGYYIKSFIEVDVLSQLLIHADWDQYSGSCVSGGVFWIPTLEFLEYSSRLLGQMLSAFLTYPEPNLRIN